MGSLKGEMRSLGEDHQPHEKTDDGERPGGSDGSAAPEGPQINMSQESTTQGDYQPKLHANASYTEEGGKQPISKDQVLSGRDTDSTDSIRAKDCVQPDAISVTQQPEADKTTAAAHNIITISDKFLSDGDAEIQREESKDKSTGGGDEAEIDSISVPVPPTPDPSDPRSPDPRSPAPPGQHHMRTQVSLEVVQCRSAATSPMTPPEGGHSFFFPSSFGSPGAVGSDTKDAELQVGQKVEFCSVATSPMTPKTPSTTAFPELIGRETVPRQSFPATETPSEAESEITGALKFSTSKTLTEGFSSNVSPESSAGCPADSNQQCKQQRMGSMDQDITILVTHHGNSEEEEEERDELSFYSIEPEVVKIDECEEPNEKSDGKISAQTATPAQADGASNTNPPQTKTDESLVPAGERVKTDDSPAVREDVSVTKPPVPESPAPFGCHNIRTQVSLEVVQCQSVATSPMTPPEGDQAFYFPSSLRRCEAVSTETKDAELQVGQQVEFRSVATAPMTPRTPTTTTFPEIRKETSVEEKIVEEEEGGKEQAEEDKEEAVIEEEEEVGKEQAEEDKEEAVIEEEKVTEKKKVEAGEEDEKEATNCKEQGEEKCEEPVQEVSWDEKGMTWEVYGAVVEVAVLGSAIQKHLEKQVKKQKKQPSLPPPPPLNPSATPLTPESTQGGSGSGKGRAGKRGERDGKVSRRRRNPFRLLMENMQQPHCCSRAHTTE